MTKKEERKTKPEGIEVSKPEKSEETIVPPGKHVRISVNGLPEKMVGGYRFTRTPTVYTPGSLKWSEDDWKAAHADPHLVIESVEPEKKS